MEHKRRHSCRIGGRTSSRIHDPHRTNHHDQKVPEIASERNQFWNFGRHVAYCLGRKQDKKAAGEDCRLCADIYLGPEAGLAGQQRDLKAAGAEKVFSEQASSVAQRTKLNECLAFLRDGDALTVTKPDRLARSTTELLAIEADLSKRGVGLVVLSMGGERLDTRNPTSKLMLTILAGVATWEREIMLERQREGIAKAKAAGKYKGRPVSIDAAQIRQLRAELGPAAIAKKLGIARSSVYRVLGA